MNPDAALTKREKQITRLLAWGAIKKEIADQLCISVHTVENHVRNIFEKTGCTKANELSAWYFCTEYKISFKLSPFARQSIAIILLALFTYGEITETHDFLRARRCRVETERTCRQRVRREEYPLVS
jgi:DNA-binding CsgD family transcriptional regulator